MFIHNGGRTKCSFSFHIGHNWHSWGGPRQQVIQVTWRIMIIPCDWLRNRVTNKVVTTISTSGKEMLQGRHCNELRCLCFFLSLRKVTVLLKVHGPEIVDMTLDSINDQGSHPNKVTVLWVMWSTIIAYVCQWGCCTSHVEINYCQYIIREADPLRDI